MIGIQNVLEEKRKVNLLRREIEALNRALAAEQAKTAKAEREVRELSGHCAKLVTMIREQNAELSSLKAPRR